MTGLGSWHLDESDSFVIAGGVCGDSEEFAYLGDGQNPVGVD